MPNSLDRLQARRQFLLNASASAGWLALGGCAGGNSSSSESNTDIHGDSGRGSGSAPDAPRVFIHPGLLHTEQDFARMQTQVQAQAEPWASGWNALVSSSRSQLDRSPRPLAVVVRGGDGQNFAQLYEDVARSYQLALRWKVSGDTAYADHAVDYLNAWSSTLTTITGNADRYLAAGIYGWEFANAAEIMRTYPGWAAADLARFQKMMLEVFYPLSSRFLREHNDAEITNYWANWDLCNIACVLATGVLCDREDIYQEAIDYYLLGAGNGAALQSVYQVHPGKLGQWQESGRDQGHCTLGIGLAAPLCEMAWNQGDDLYGIDDSRFLAGAEYVARSNLTQADGSFYDLPYMPLTNKQGTSYGISPAGRPHLRPVWECVQHHYEGRLGIATPFVRRMAEKLRPEWDGGNGDQLGFGTLTFSRVALSSLRPSGLRAHRRGDTVVLSWWGVPGADSYDVERGSARGGPYTAIASGISDPLTFTDVPPAGGGSMYYVVRARSQAGLSAPSDEAAIAQAPRPVYTLPNSPGTSSTVSVFPWTDGRNGGRALLFDGTDRKFPLPDGLMGELGDFTVAAWIYMDEARRNAWVFSMGSGTRRWMFLMPCNGRGTISFAISTVHGYNAEWGGAEVAVPVGAWAHLAVTQRADVGSLYLDGQLAGTNTGMALSPRDLGNDAPVWIGRSPYPNDPAFKGKVQDLRIYEGALSAAAVAALAAS
jgi:Concanavalin A-like lectin/glucanases superfamily/Alginate lyase